MIPASTEQLGQRNREARTIDLYERLGRFTDLIFCPLDLPAPPQVSRHALVDWVIGARAQRVTAEERLSSGFSETYPWNSAYAAREGKWCGRFDRRFPEIKRYLGLFPTASWRAITVLIQEPRRDVWLHTDPDPVLGWRVYLGHGGARVFFCPAFERHRERLSTWTREGRRDWSKFVRTGQKLYARLPANSCSWTLTQYRAAHGVETHPGEAGERITLLINPEVGAIDVDAYLSLLERSIEKYAEYAIWYSTQAVRRNDADAAA